ncbi:MAG: EscU/YscU/HrcU family type III secretion system export apparatus switch protein [Polyangiaceae bacterium]|nr:EscU/YscU/HrcU family type III secretion system export apparatus switch protein [Polyangiaceae bacterium]
MSSDGERDNAQHPATPKRRDDFRKQGRFARARDATGVAALGATVVVLDLRIGPNADAARELFERCLGDAGAMVRGAPLPLGEMLARFLAPVAVPPALAAAGAACVVGAAQAGLRLYPELLAFDVSRLSPLPRVKQLFDLRHAGFELLLALGKVGLMTWACYGVVSEEVPALVHQATLPVASALPLLGVLTLRVALRALCVLGALTALDYLHNRFSLAKEMRMTTQELKDEARQSELDPHVKARIKQRMHAAWKRRASFSLRHADVVVTNPTHISVALRYGAKDSTPVVVQKGHDHAALRIRQRARALGIPIVENRALARALDVAVAVGEPVPAAHFVAVARVLAFVYRLHGRRRAARGR